MALAVRQQEAEHDYSAGPNTKRPKYELTPALEQALIQVPQHERLTGLAGPTMRLIGHGGEVFGCEFSPDGKRLASCSFDNKIFLWNVYGDSENYGCLEGHANAVLEVHWSKDMSSIYSCSADKSVAVWDAETGQRIKKLKGHSEIVNSVQCSRSGEPMLCSGGDDGSTKLWDLRTKRCVHSFDHMYQILAVSFDARTQKIFAASLDDTIRVFDVRTRAEEELYVLKGHTDSITGIDLSPDGEMLISNSMDQSVRIWDVRPHIPYGESRCIGEVRGHLHNYEKNLRCRWSADGTHFASGSADRNVYVWSANSKQLVYKLPGHDGSVNDVAFHPRSQFSAPEAAIRRFSWGTGE